jgi:protein-serine/threonine kinase
MDPNNPNNPNNPNRLNMNYGYDQNYNANNRAYPTTPSAFPQPIYQTQGAQDYVDPSNPAYAPGYFMNNGYAPQAPQYVQQQQYAQQQALQSPQPAYQTRMGYANDGTNGLIQQFSNQDLNANRGNFFNRAASPAQRPRTAGGSPAAGPTQAAHLAPPVPRSPRPPAENEELQRFPDRYSENVHKRGKAAKELVTVFFHENIERARDRNMRYVSGPCHDSVDD